MFLHCIRFIALQGRIVNTLRGGELISLFNGMMNLARGPKGVGRSRLPVEVSMISQRCCLEILTGMTPSHS